MTIVPRYISWARWSAETASALYQYGQPAISVPEAKWRDFASSVVAIPAIAATEVPRPEGFTRWQDWADAYNQSVQTIGL